jgi:NitT/TauT family transport system substrate-binding protein
MMTRPAETISPRGDVIAGAIAGVLLLAVAALGRPAAAADAPTLRISRGFDLAELPLIVAEHEHLIEKQAIARNLGQVTVQWLPPGNLPVADSLAQNQADIATGIDLAIYVAAWDERAGTPQEIRALATLARMPYQLLSRNAAIATIRDFTAKDRIAVPAVKASLPAVMLEMAAAQEWGRDQYGKLDPITVALPDPAGVAALHAGSDGVTTHFTRVPYSDEERADRAVHRVMDSFDIAGPHSVGVLVTTAHFRDDNPQLCAAVIAAIDEAGVIIKQNPGTAAEIYVKAAGTESFTVEDLTDMLGDPDIGFAAAPAGMLHLARFLRQTSRLKHEPASWRELFFPEAHKLSGS